MFGSNEGVSLCSGPAEAPDPERRAATSRASDARDRLAAAVAPVDRHAARRPRQRRRIKVAGVPGELPIRGPTVFDG